MNSRDTMPGVHFLLLLIEHGDAAAVRQRLGIGVPEQLTDEGAAWELDRLAAPRSVQLWMLERDDPGTNRLVFHRAHVGDAVKRDILRGLPFGAATGPLPVRVDCGQPYCSHAEPDIPVSRRGLIEGLREARTMGAARTAARAVSKPDWAAVAEADRAEPLPGFARWALGVRIDCPPEVRAQFGSHPKFTKRLRDAGIVEVREYVLLGRPPRDVLAVLRLGTRLFPHRVAEAAEVLAPLVRAELGANPDAWAVLAQLLPSFAGTVPELVVTSGAVARP
ncbi:hypothetical protein QRX60_49540 [Amycolatopsis mongoliensis]|uniref:Uncharacterized protein n=1 Tax=Amycolatopsis mongoliensis TaxID=715475 RepID=A0A9Y2NHK1_9PSEU|nr:hypothetical protein [Amycolatopsis sp. 4-36]WIY01964.1 hypothetical protein QRX60_49540 [Amycolatopsis sp. 4-36]